jgi:four helix bundle protein
MELVVQVYQVSAGIPREEIYGLTSQVRRAAVSVPSNIAEGQGRGVGNEFRHHLRIAQGSLQETETQLMIAERLGFVTAQRLQSVMELANEVGRLLRGLHQSVSTSN